MLLTVHGLPEEVRYSDLKSLLRDECKLNNVILDNLLQEGRTKKVTVGFSSDEEGQILLDCLDGFQYGPYTLSIELHGKKPMQRERPRSPEYNQNPNDPYKRRKLDKNQELDYENCDFQPENGTYQPQKPFFSQNQSYRPSSQTVTAQNQGFAGQRQENRSFGFQNQAIIDQNQLLSAQNKAIQLQNKSIGSKNNKPTKPNPWFANIVQIQESDMTALGMQQQAMLYAQERLNSQSQNPGNRPPWLMNTNPVGNMAPGQMNAPFSFGAPQDSYQMVGMPVAVPPVSLLPLQPGGRILNPMPGLHSGLNMGGIQGRPHPSDRYDPKDNSGEDFDQGAYPEEFDLEQRRRNSRASNRGQRNVPRNSDDFERRRNASNIRRDISGSRSGFDDREHDMATSPRTFESGIRETDRPTRSFERDNQNIPPGQRYFERNERVGPRNDPMINRDPNRFDRGERTSDRRPVEFDHEIEDFIGFNQANKNFPDDADNFDRRPREFQRKPTELGRESRRAANNRGPRGFKAPEPPGRSFKSTNVSRSRQGADHRNPDRNARGIKRSFDGNLSNRSQTNRVASTSGSSSTQKNLSSNVRGPRTRVREPPRFLENRDRKRRRSESPLRGPSRRQKTESINPSESKRGNPTRPQPLLSLHIEPVKRLQKTNVSNGNAATFEQGEETRRNQTVAKVVDDLFDCKLISHKFIKELKLKIRQRLDSALKTTGLSHEEMIKTYYLVYSSHKKLKSKLIRTVRSAFIKKQKEIDPTFDEHKFYMEINAASKSDIKNPMPKNEGSVNLEQVQGQTPGPNLGSQTAGPQGEGQQALGQPVQQKGGQRIRKQEHPAQRRITQKQERQTKGSEALADNKKGIPNEFFVMPWQAPTRKKLPQRDSSFRWGAIKKLTSEYLDFNKLKSITFFHFLRKAIAIKIDGILGDRTGLDVQDIYCIYRDKYPETTDDKILDEVKERFITGYCSDNDDRNILEDEIATITKIEKGDQRKSTTASTRKDLPVHIKKGVRDFDNDSNVLPKHKAVSTLLHLLIEPTHLLDNSFEDFLRKDLTTRLEICCMGKLSNLDADGIIKMYRQRNSVENDKIYLENVKQEYISLEMEKNPKFSDVAFGYDFDKAVKMVGVLNNITQDDNNNRNSTATNILKGFYDLTSFPHKEFVRYLRTDVRRRIDELLLDKGGIGQNEIRAIYREKYPRNADLIYMDSMKDQYVNTRTIANQEIFEKDYKITTRRYGVSKKLNEIDNNKRDSAVTNILGCFFDLTVFPLKVFVRYLRTDIRSRIDEILIDKSGFDTKDIQAIYRAKYPIESDLAYLDSMKEQFVNTRTIVDREFFETNYDLHTRALREKQEFYVEKEKVLSQPVTVAQCYKAPIKSKLTKKQRRKINMLAKLDKLQKETQSDKVVLEDLVNEEREIELLVENIYAMPKICNYVLKTELNELSNTLTAECDEILKSNENSDEVINDQILTHAKGEIVRLIGLEASKRIHLVPTNLAIRIFGSPKLPRKAVLEQFLKKYGALSLKKSDRVNMFVANFSNYENYDAILKLGNAQISDLTVTFKPFQLTGSKPNKVEKEQKKIENIQGNIDFTTDDFNITADSSEFVAASAEFVAANAECIAATSESVDLSECDTDSCILLENPIRSEIIFLSSPDPASPECVVILDDENVDVGNNDDGKELNASSIEQDAIELIKGNPETNVITKETVAATSECLENTAVKKEPTAAHQELSENILTADKIRQKTHELKIQKEMDALFTTIDDLLEDINDDHQNTVETVHTVSRIGNNSDEMGKTSDENGKKNEKAGIVGNETGKTANAVGKESLKIEEVGKVSDVAGKTNVNASKTNDKPDNISIKQEIETPKNIPETGETILETNKIVRETVKVTKMESETEEVVNKTENTPGKNRKTPLKTENTQVARVLRSGRRISTSK